MRITFFSALLTSLVVAGCGKPEAKTPGNALAAPVAAGDARATPAATTVPAEPARAPEPTPAAAWREVTLPAGTQLAVTLDTPVGSDTSRVEQPVAAHLTRPIHVQGQTVLAAGSRVGGVVTDATQSAKVKGRAHVAMRFTSLTPHGGDERYTISTAPVARTAEGTKEKDAIKIGAPAAGGAIIGALVGGKKGALVGTAVGGGAGTAAVLSTRGKEVHLGKGAALTLRLSAPVTIKVRG
ncbi:MAG TPA: hypothetical protein VGP77_11075 [Vicinamibacterales bacterium]|jgi:hypothetical protein|nr:hypothetical protein [Vicinamibacterales bacterium]